MSFEVSNPSPFFCKEEELDYLIWKERMRKLERLQNEFALTVAESKLLSMRLLAWISTRKLYCEKCNVRFYSNEGFVNHGCFA